ncbi:MAG: response regulator transcription factor [Verrucomicrobiales bacterium]|nr:response regulator transcription factor [Verrucomicrobiales bacterium]
MKTILIIEDQPDMRENIATILEMENYAVLTAHDGAQGIEAAREEKPDLILCDVMMPKLDGHGVLQKLREDRTIAGTPFVFLTAKGEKRDLRMGMNLGADDYLTKPVTATDLLAAVSARLEREHKRPLAEFHPDFTSAAPLEQALGLTAREAEVLLWVAQGKSNPEISTILGAAENTIKKHLHHVFEKIGVDNRNAATVLALEILNGGEAARARPSV